MPLLALLLISLGACSGGPKVEVGVVNSNTESLQVADADGQLWVLKAKDAEGWSCISPRDTQKFMAACRRYGVEVRYCVMDGASLLSGCSTDFEGKPCNPENPMLGCVVHLEAIDSWACLSPEDRKTILKYCKKG